MPLAGALARPIVVLLVALGATVGCTPGPQAGPAGGATAIPALPPCASAGAAVTLPTGVPGNLPLPPGTMVTSVQVDGGRTLLGGVVPTDLQTAARFFQTALPAAGFKLGEGDAEPDEAESVFTGNGVKGQWKVHSITGCPGAVNLTLAVQPE